MTQRTCDVGGCDRAHRAKGYCAAHYNAILKPDRHRTVIVCAECGEVYETKRTNGRYCSLACRDAEGRRRKALVGPLPWTRAPRPAVARPRKSEARVFIAGACAWCGAGFVGRLYGTPDRFCSRTCGTYAAKAARGQWLIERTLRLALYERDRWTCQLCDEPVDRTLPRNDDWAASLDHIKPRSAGGGHEPSNLRLAHRWCNAVRGAAEDFPLARTS